MKYNEEHIADNLYENLKRYFKGKGEFIIISKEGAGVHWDCNLESKERKSKIHCFEHRYYNDIKPEYLISFEELGINKAWGRTHDLKETILSSEDWINKKKIEDLHRKYEFIDWSKRRIIGIENQLIKNEPMLNQTDRKFSSPWGSGLYDYSIMFKNRSSELTGYGNDEPISFMLQWDGCNLFEVKQDNLKLLAEVMKKWLIDEINPSKLENDYEWIEIAELAKFYEKGEGIKGEFIESWNSIERFYNQLSDEWHPFKKDALKLIKEMRSEGLDKEIRVGQSLFFFILSRARRHGLEASHPYIHITFLGNNKMKIKSKSTTKKEELECEVKYEGYFKEIVGKLIKEKIE